MLGAKPAQILEKPCNVPNCDKCGDKWNECATCKSGYLLKNKRCLPVCSGAWCSVTLGRVEAPDSRVQRVAQLTALAGVRAPLPPAGLALQAFTPARALVPMHLQGANLQTAMATQPASTVAANTEASFVVTVKNTGPQPALQVTLALATSPLPGGGTWKATVVNPSEDAATCSDNASSCALGTLGIDKTATVTIKSTPTAAGTLTSAARVDAINKAACQPPNCKSSAAMVVEVGNRRCAAWLLVRETQLNSSTPPSLLSDRRSAPRLAQSAASLPLSAPPGPRTAAAPAPAAWAPLSS